MTNILIASDADWIHNEVKAALGDPDTTFRSVRSGAEALKECAEQEPDLAVIDLQIGNMGGMATCHALRLDESVGALGKIPVLMLLDRDADVFLAKRSEADGWLIKPLDAFRLRKAGKALLAGETYFEQSAIARAGAAG